MPSLLRPMALLVGYLVFMWFVNVRRRWHFRKTLAPRLIELAGAPGESNYIGTSEFGLSRA